jgi:hypothetical protein
MNSKEIEIMSIYKNIVMVFLLFLLNSGKVKAQYKYTRFAFDVTGGFSMPNTSITGEAGGYSEIGLKVATSKYLSGRLALGIGTLTGAQQVDKITGTIENVANYTKYNTTYNYFSGSGLLNIERLFKLRSLGKLFNRLNPFLMIGAGYMYPDVKVNRVDGQFKNYKKNVRFIANNFGLDFKYFISNRFDLSFGAEYKLVQTYYLDGAYSDKRYDGMTNAYLGISYNIGASADRKHLNWFNLDGVEELMFVPIDNRIKQGEVPIVESKNPLIDTISALVKETVINPIDVDSNLAQIQEPNIINNDSITKNNQKTDDKNPVVVITTPVTTDTSEFKKFGRHSNIKGKPETSAPIEVAVSPKSQPGSGISLNDIDDIVRPMGKYNVIVGTYAGAKYAYPFRDKMRKQGLQAALFKDSDRSKMVRVCIYYGDDRKEANRQLRLYLNKFNGQVWLHIYDPK